MTDKETIEDLVKALETTVPYLRDFIDHKNRDMDVSVIGAELALSQANAAIKRARK